MPPGVTSIIVECWGAGGAGGGSTANNSRGGGGGAGGSYARKTLSVIPGAVYPISVGGATPGIEGAGSNGNPSWFGTTATVYAEGGAGGAAPNGGTTAGGTGSTVNCVGDVVFPGGNGSDGSFSASGAGGGGAGTTGPGGNASGTTAGTGTSLNGGNGGTGRTTENDGSDGLVYGGGGGGAFIPDNSNHSGGNGSGGLVVITWNAASLGTSGTFTIPAGVSTVFVQCWGAGGAGGGNNTGNDGGGGGGGGAYSSSEVSVIPGVTYTVNIGTGGTGGTGNGTGGGDTWFISSATILAKGGTGGFTPVAGAGGIAGTGGAAASGIGTVRYSGGNGGRGRDSNTGRGGPGGSSAGYSADGTSGPATWSTTVASAAPDGGGMGGNGGAPNPTAGSVPGGGGGGAGENRSGADGANGFITINWSSPVFYSQNTGDPSNLSNWKTLAGYSPENFTTNNQTFIVSAGHTLTTGSSGWTVSGNNTAVIIMSGATLTESYPVNLSANTSLVVENGGVLNHNVNSLTIFNGSEMFASTSTVTYGYAGNQVIADATYGNLTLSGSGSKNINSPAIEGIMSMEGTATASALPLYGGSATLRYGGSGIQTTGPEFPALFNGTGGVVFDNSNGVILSASHTVESSIVMLQGTINTGAHVLSLTNSLASALTRTSGTITGKFMRTVSATSADYIFPVGTTSHYRPAIFNFTSLGSTTNITAEFIDTPPAGFDTYLDDVSNLSALFTEGYWRFQSSTTPAVNYTLTLNGNGFTSYMIDDATRISARDNGNNTWRAAGTHGTMAGTTVSRTGVTTLNTTFFDFAFAEGCIPTSLGYEYERSLTIDHARVAGSQDLHNFPVLVNITGQDFLKNYPAGRIYNSSGFDIIFTDDSYNQLDHQIEYFNGTTGELVAWVRIPTLSCTTNTTVKMLYGNLQITNDPSVTTVWDSHYRGVWHMDDNNLNDFTIYDKAATPYNTPTYPAGRIRNALGLNGSSHYASVLNAPNINFSGNITVSAWVYMGAGNRDQKITGNQNNSSGGFKFGIYSNNKVEFEIRNSANNPTLNRDVAGGTVLSTGQWYYLAGMSSDVLDSIKTSVNGIGERPFKKTGTLGIASNDLVIGREPFTGLYYFNGRFDELRISDKVRSDGWLRTEYFNQLSPSTFYSISGETASSNLPSEGICTGPIPLTFGFPEGGVYSGHPDIAGDVFTPPAPGTYTIIYTYAGNCGPTSISKNFIITDIPPPPVAQDKSYCSDQITYLEATSGENIKWYYGGVPVSTANPFSTGQTVPGEYTYTVTQTINGCEGSPESVTLTIYNTVTIGAHPVPVVICEGNNASFTVTPAGYNPSFQWQENGVNISEGGIYSGVNTATLTLINPGTVNNGKNYRCVVTSTCGSASVTSNAALLTVNPLPVATFSYTATPYCPNAANPSPVFSGGGIAGTFSSTAGLVFVSVSTGQVNIAASTPGEYTVINTIAASAGCTEVIATSPFSITSELVWTGASGTGWNTAANWSCGFVPAAALSVRIPDVANKPILSPGLPGIVKDLTIEPGASLTVTDNTLQITGAISNSGTFDVTAGKIEFTGTGPRAITAGTFTGNTVKDLTVNNSDEVTLLGPLNITGILYLMNGDLVSDGNLTLFSDATGTALIDGSGSGDVTGIVTMQRYLPSAFGYKYFSSPFQAATVGEFGDDMDLASAFPRFYAYDENRWFDIYPLQPFVAYTDTDGILSPMNGYSINFGSDASPKTIDVSGLVNNGSYSVTLYNHNHPIAIGRNLVGNPYPSPINWSAAQGWTKSNIDNALYYFKASLTDEWSGSYSSWINGVSSDGLASNIIPSMQGFLVHVSDGSYPVTATLSMDYRVRVNNFNQPFMSKGAEDEKSLVRLSATFSDQQQQSDPFVVYLDDKATAGFDSELDAFKYFNTDITVPNLYSFAGSSLLSISALPLPEEEFAPLPVGLKTERNGEIIFRLKDAGGSFAFSRIYLKDASTGELNDLTENDYRVFLTAGEYNSRFSIEFEDFISGLPPGASDLPVFEAYSARGIVYTEIRCPVDKEGTIILSNLTGQTHIRKKVYANGHYEFTPGVSTGIYIISYISGNIRLSEKIFIQGQ